MGLFDRAKRLFGVGSEEEKSPPVPAESAPLRGDDGPRPRPTGRRDERERPPLPDIEKAPTTGVDDALEAWEKGDKQAARKLLREADRGRGLRTVLRAAAALDAGDEEELRSLLEAIAREEPSHRLPLQVAAALGDPVAAAPYLARAEREGAPRWALAWARATSTEPVTRREGLVDLLFADAPLARTVAARDLHVEGVEVDPEGLSTYAGFVHGRESIRRFGAETVARLLDRAGVGGLR